MYIMRKITLLITFAVATCFAQTKKVGDYIESFSNNKPSGMQPREMQYMPQNGDFVCVNGKNRFTRALYGSNTEYRIETSDKPAFALYKGKNYRNVRFYVNDVLLDSADDCEARYGKGRRSYVVKDSRWGKNAVLRIECVAMHEKEGGYWHFSAEGFEDRNVVLRSKVCTIAIPKLRRNGDIGADKPGCFEPSADEEGLQECTLTFSDEAYAVTTPAAERQLGHLLTLKKADKETAEGYEASKRYFETLSERVSFTTPEPMFNTLGSTLVLAADGAWDGETWLHGAIGWRMPLAGWRAGYLGDVLGWNDRAVSHFDAYARSQVTDVPATIASPSQDPEMNLARAEKKWGTQMYSNGYICRNPNRNNQMHHYDMNLNYIDELLWHFQYDADTAYMRKMWPVLTSHLEWEKRNFDKDGNHLYDAYCCIWASDALYYNGGEVTHSTAYNYRGNLLAAKIARMIGKDATPYQKEADAILEAMNKSLWVKNGVPHWAEYKDVMGLKRVHPNAALWSVYTPVDCGVGSAQQKYSCMQYVDACIPHIPVEIKSMGDVYAPASLISTSNWMPYSWSINNVASAEIMHTALAFFEAGMADKGMELVRANLLDQMYLGASPGNLGQISYYDAARGESYRDFGDNIGISARAIVQGVFGIVPQALDGNCVVRPGFPLEWDSTEVKTPYLSYKYKRVGASKAEMEIKQNFRRNLNIIVRINTGNGDYRDYALGNGDVATVTFDIPEKIQTAAGYATTVTGEAYEKANSMQKTAGKQVSVEVPYNSNVTDIFRNQYLSPRPQSTSLELPVQGIGEWCHPKFTVEINDSVFRSVAKDGAFEVEGIRFATPQKGRNIAFASLWDNYPDEVTIPVKGGKGMKGANFIVAGSTNHMQFDMDNALITANYADGSRDTLILRPPYNYCPIEQDYYVDGKAFRGAKQAPLRISFSTGKVSRTLGAEMGIPATEVYGRELAGGAAQVVAMPLNAKKKVKSFTLRCLSNDVVVGVMAITMVKEN